MNNNINVAVGKNFSGRSEFLKSQCNDYSKGIYIGEIPSNYISGISPTVKSELDLFSLYTNHQTLKVISTFILDLGFNKSFDSNPFLLSGGEQAILTILSGLLAEPSLLAVDTIFEQLSDEWKNPLFLLLQKELKQQKILIADNRINEYNFEYKAILVKDDRTYKYPFPEPYLMNLGNGISAKRIIIKNLTFGYKKNSPVLKEINLTLEPGNIYFLKGINGAGKSTLAKILAGILHIKKGDIYVDGNSLNPYRQPGILFGYSFQNPDEQLFSRTVLHEIIGKKKDENEAFYKHRELFLKIFGLENLQNLHPAELPYVMRKRVSLAATLANDRPWYIIDEPTIGQDDSFVDFLVFLFNQLTSKGKGLVIISHSQTFIDKFRAKYLYLENGFLRSN